MEWLVNELIVSLAKDRLFSRYWSLRAKHLALSGRGQTHCKYLPNADSEGGDMLIKSLLFGYQSGLIVDEVNEKWLVLNSALSVSNLVAKC